MEFGPIQEKWLQSLEQHPERQGTMRLGIKIDGEYKACCLGELGIIAGICIWKGDSLVVDTLTNRGEYLSDRYTEVGLNDFIGSHKDNINRQSLAYLNDKGSTWPEIAAIVRASPEKYFNKSV